LKRKLISIQSANPDMPINHIEALQAAVTQLTQMENKVEAHLSSANNAIDKVRFNKIVSTQMERIEEILIATRQKMGT